MTYADLTEALQARLRSHREPVRNAARKLPDSDGRRRIETLEAQIAMLQDAVATTEALGEQQRQEAGAAAKRVDSLEADIVTLKEVIATAQALAEQRRQEAETAVKRLEVLEAHFAQIAVGINLAIMMGKGHVTGFDVKRLQGIADSISGMGSAL